jgi:2-polyprenyl-3-methyl-5-hydroxy-6-metoxy-1,4-benzoquinol methylase
VTHRPTAPGDTSSIVGAALMVAVGLHLRSRARSLHTLEASEDEPDPEHLFLALRGVRLDDATRRAASAHARRDGLDVVDIVPGDLDAEHASEVLTWLDPKTYRADRLAFGQSATQAMLVTRDVADRAKLDVGEDLDLGQLVLAAEAARKYARNGSGIAVAHGSRARPLDPDERAALLQARLGDFGHSQAGVETLLTLGLALGLVSAARRRSPWPLAPLVAHALQPLMRFAETTIRPADLGPATWGRWPRRLARLAGTQRAMLRPDPQAASIEGERAVYEEMLAGGTRALFGPRRDDCYLCGSTDLTVALASPDLHQLKPGRFVLERCGRCGHLFQNPPLSDRGLGVYYRDFYDGLSERHIDQHTETLTPLFRGRAEMLRGLAEPTRWLDVGTGNGRFCVCARQLWPETGFDGLDMRSSVEEAQRRGWVDRAYSGELVDVADDLAGSYDVVSMHHYLEHTRDPRAELDAATKLLRPGGHLLLELPDPEFPLAQLLGILWTSWVPMQHLHLLSIGNLESLLEERGYTIVRRARGRAHIGQDMVGALVMVLKRLAPPHVPWRPQPTPAARLRRGTLLAAAGPAFVLAFLADVVLNAVVRAADRGNAYRVVARARGAS